MLGVKLTKVIESKGVKNRSSLAKIFGITPQLLYKYERGIVEPSIDFVMKFVKHFNLSLESFLSENEETASNSNDVILRSSEDMEILKESVSDQII